MKKLILLILFPVYLAATPFGFISYTTDNIGDDIQSIAAKQFLPDDSLFINREFVGAFEYEGRVDTIINGWYMYTKDYGWYINHIPPPSQSWPPVDAINPLLISIHFTQYFIPTLLSKQGIAYMKKNGPVGARDLFTLELLQNNGVPSYFSGCLTLTLENNQIERDPIIYAVDIDDACLRYIRKNSGCQVKVIKHDVPNELIYNPSARLEYAQRLLDMYKRAKCVITTRLHAFLPCLAFQTPVILINVAEDQYRFSGLKELGRNGSRSEFLRGKIPFNFDFPPENPTDYLSIRSQLIETVTGWVNANTLDPSD